jgi:RimJ/RimL family protein N-acetyltransferase
MNAPTLETERLVLRSFRADDHGPYAAMSADPEVMRFIGTGATQTPAESWRSMAFLIGHWALRGYGMWAIELRSSGELVGRAGFLEPPGWPGFELGWLLARPHWGHGYATEAARAALRYAFVELGRERVISLIRPGNERSVKVARSIGSALEGEVDLLGAKALVYATHRPDP